MSRQTLIIIIVIGVLVTSVLTTFFIISNLNDDLRGGRGSALGYITIKGTIVDSRETVRQLKALDKNSQVKGILVRVESPGGGVTAAHEIYSEIRRIGETGKPVVVSMGTVAASGGYYISAPATVIVANPGTLTGSIGVIMELPIIRGLLDKLGMKVEVIKSREAKDVGSPFRDMTETDRRLLQDVVSDVYEQFLQVVSQERNIPIDSLRRIADGRILTGKQAKNFGLVDTLGTLEDAKRILADLCGIKGEPRWVRPTTRLRSWISRMFDEELARILGVPQFPEVLYRWF